MIQSDTLRKTLTDVRILLLELHKILIDLSKVDYERDREPIDTPGKWIHLLMNDDFFGWLHPLSTLITSLDELLELASLDTIDGAAIRVEIESLIGGESTKAHDFRSNYINMMQREPSVVIVHARLKQTLLFLPLPEPEQINDIAVAKSRWSAARVLKRALKTKLPL